MVADWTMITIVLCIFMGWLFYNVIMPMFNAYLEYKMHIKQFETPPVEVHGPMGLYEERLQRDTDGSNPSEEIRKSRDGVPVSSSEELPL